MLATFDSRKSYFNDIGTQITGTQKTAEALKISGLDYQVEKKEIYLRYLIYTNDYHFEK